MVKLKEKRLLCAFKQKEKGIKNKYLAYRLNVGIRRFQQLYAIYKMTGEIPRLKSERRPKTELTQEDKGLIDKALKESLLGGAVTIRLYIAKYYEKKLPYTKIHRYLTTKGISKPDKKKQKQRKYCRYERKHSFSLVHLDWHGSKCIPNKWVCVVEDDASRLIPMGGEFDNALGEHGINLLNQARKIALKQYSSLIREVNTDKGSQFFSNKKDSKGNKALAEFEKHLMQEGIKHIPSRRNHPQTNGKEERWFRTYEENRTKFKSFKEFMKGYNNKIHLGLNRKEGVTPNEAALHKLRTASLLNLFFRRLEKRK